MGKLPLFFALEYIEKYGWPVFPVSWDGQKIPKIKDWPNAATTDSAQIRAWWQKWPQAFVGLACGKAGFVVVDIDCKKDDANGFHTLADDYCLYDMPETPQVFTWSAGVHLYFGANPACVIGNSIGKHGLGPGLDIRGAGGFAVLPCGNGYSWHTKLNFDTVEPLIAPAWLGRRIRKERTGDREQRRWFNPNDVLVRACERIRTAADGDKHYQVNNNALRIGSLVGAGFLREAEAWEDLQAATASLIRHSDADPRQTWRALEKAFGDGLNSPRRARR
jgi:hypothetical protein